MNTELVKCTSLVSSHCYRCLPVWGGDGDGEGGPGCAGTGAAARTGHSPTLLARPLGEGHRGKGTRVRPQPKQKRSSSLDGMQIGLLKKKTAKYEL